MATYTVLMDRLLHLQTATRFGISMENCIELVDQPLKMRMGPDIGLRTKSIALTGRPMRMRMATRLGI